MSAVEGHAPVDGAFDLARLYRAHIQPAFHTLPERTAFVDASSERAARLKIASVLAALEGCAPTDAEQRLYNLKSAHTCIDEGASADHELRLFEVGWGASIVFVSEPLFLVAQPGRLARLWSRTPAAVRP